MAGRERSALALELLHRLGERLVVGRAGLAGDAETFAQLRHARVLHADLEHGPLAMRAGPAFALAAARLGELRLQRLVAVVRRIVARERLTGVLGVGHLGQDIGGLGKHCV